MKQFTPFPMLAFGFAVVLLFTLLIVAYVSIGSFATGNVLIGWGAILGLMGGGLPALLIVCFDRARRTINYTQPIHKESVTTTALTNRITSLLHPRERIKVTKVAVLPPYPRAIGRVRHLIPTKKSV